MHPNACDVASSPSQYFASSSAFFSYEACGESSTFSDISASTLSVSEVVNRVSDYTCATKRVLEDQIADWHLGNGDKDSPCAYLDSCPCVDCVESDGWGQAVDLTDSVLVRPAACTDDQEQSESA